MLILVIIIIANIMFASFLKDEELYPDRKIYRILSLIPPLTIVYIIILLIFLLIMTLVDMIKEILE